ncbi:MAG: hemolysin family protein [Acetanaerobacterium sp.]
MDPDGILYIALLIVLILINAFFAGSEIAIIQVNDNKVHKLAEEGHKKAQLLLGLVAEPSSFLATIQIGVTISGFLASAVAADSFAEPIALALEGHVPLPASALKLITVIVVTIILSYFTLVFGELVPKRIAMQNPEKFAFSAVGALTVLYKGTRPFVWLLSKSTNGVVRLFGIDPDHEPDRVTEEEIRMLVDVGNERGVIEASQKEMINNIFELDDITAAEIMTHRTDIMGVESTDSIEDVVSLAINEGYSRIPIFEDDLDDILGVVYVKDLLCLIGCKNSEEFSLQDFIRPVLFVPESNHVKELFKEFQDKKIQFAVVCDEYGGTSGIVTMEDLLEAIVGNIQDEYDNEEDEIKKVDETTFTVDGATDIEELSDILDVPLPDEGDYETIAGLIIDILGRIPSENEHPTVVVNNVEFTVLKVEDRRIESVKVVKLPPPPEEDNEDDNNSARKRD